MVEFKSVAEIPKRPRTALTGHLSQMLAIVSFCGQRSLLLMAFAERRSKCACEGRCPGIEIFNALLLTVQPSPPRSSTCWPSAVCTVDESATCASLFHKCMVRIEAYNHQASHVCVRSNATYTTVYPAKRHLVHRKNTSTKPRGDRLNQRLAVQNYWDGIMPAVVICENKNTTPASGEEATVASPSCGDR